MKNAEFKAVSIIGFGRFGKVLYRLLQDSFDTIYLFDKNDAAFTTKETLLSSTVVTSSLKKVYSADIIFYAVPIEQFEKTIREHRHYFTNQLLVDVLSVKELPQKVFQKYTQNTHVQFLLTHPMFGPDSSKNGFADLPIVLDQGTATPTVYAWMKTLFTQKGLRVVELSAKEHDKLAANSQGITHLIGRVLREFGFSPTPIDTLGAKKLHEVMTQTCNDTWTLFSNLQQYNEYTPSMRAKFTSAVATVSKKLIPTRAENEPKLYGIQGGPGSFNDEAIHRYFSERKCGNGEIKYLYRTRKVLHHLDRGDIDFGLFAIHNTLGGMVQESLEAMGQYNFTVVYQFSMPIRHFLMKRKDVAMSEIKTIMAHPQVLKQCAQTLARDYSAYELASGTGDLVDTATAAKAVALGTLPKNIAILGSRAISELYDFDTVAENLQDSDTNMTTFLLVTRP